MRKTQSEFAVYVSVQVAVYGLEWLTYLSCRTVGVPLVIGNVAAKGVAACAAFFAHRRFTFPGNAGHPALQASRYAIALAINAILSTALFWMLSHVVPEWMAKLVSDIMIVVVTFLITKSYVFRISQ